MDDLKKEAAPQPVRATTFMGVQVYSNPHIPPQCVEFRGPDGKVIAHIYNVREIHFGQA